MNLPLTIEDDCGAWPTVLHWSERPWEARLALDTSASAAGSVRVGDRVTFRTTITNTGESGAPGAVLVGTMPAGLTLESAMASAGTCTGTPPVVCDLGYLGPGATSVATIVARVGSAGTHRLTAYAASDGYDRIDGFQLVTTVVEARP